MATKVKTVVTVETFSTVLSSIETSSKTLRDDVQAVIEFGLQHYIGKGNGDAGYLTRLVHSANKHRTLPAKTIKNYILAQANLVWSTDKKKVLRFAKIAKAELPEVNMLGVSWYEWEGNGANQATADFNVTNRINSFVKSLQTAKDENRKIKTDGLDEAVKGLLSALGFKVQIDEGTKEKLDDAGLDSIPA